VVSTGCPTGWATAGIGSPASTGSSSEAATVALMNASSALRCGMVSRLASTGGIHGSSAPAGWLAAARSCMTETPGSTEANACST